MVFYLNFVKKVCYSWVSVRYNQEGSVFDSSKPNQAFIFVCYKREFVITKFVITKFHCVLSLDWQGYQRSRMDNIYHKIEGCRPEFESCYQCSWPLKNYNVYKANCMKHAIWILLKIKCSFMEATHIQRLRLQINPTFSLNLEPMI